MKSAVPKVLHRIAGRSLLAHVLGTVREAEIDDVAVVIGPDREDVAAEARRWFPGVVCSSFRPSGAEPRMRSSPHARPWRKAMTTSSSCSPTRR